MSVHTALYQFVVSCTALYPLAYVLAHTSTYHLVPPCTRGTGFQMSEIAREQILRLPQLGICMPADGKLVSTWREHKQQKQRNLGLVSFGRVPRINKNRWTVTVANFKLNLGCTFLRVEEACDNPFPKPIENVALNSDRPQRFGLV